VRFTPRAWRYLLPLLLLPGTLFALGWRQADTEGARLGRFLSQPPAAVDSVDGAELLLQFVGSEELQRQAQHEIDALLQ
jgi:hypothetical protein